MQCAHGVFFGSSLKLFFVFAVIYAEIRCSSGAVLPETADGKHEENSNRNEIATVEPRKKEQGDMMSKIMPMMVIPFLISTAMIPMMLVSLKFMLLQSMLVGKIAIVLMLINMFRSRASGQGEVTSHNVNERDWKMSMAHYGYNGEDEYGAYVNSRRKRR